MKIGMIGLGLIGGSMARAYKTDGHTVFAIDTDPVTLGWAKLSGVIDAELTPETIPECELIMPAVLPEAAAKWLIDNSEYISKDALVIDLCGTKRYICKIGFELAEKYGYTFAGGHPMAGTHLSGIKNSRADLFCGQPMVIVPPRADDITLFARIKDALSPAGFGKFTFTTAEEHDKMIAFTSQLAHVVSNAYIKSPRSAIHSGVSAGSYRDMTRVAWLNENMWTQLFLENRDNLICEIDFLIKSLSEYKNALESEDAEYLRTLLRDGRIAKEISDGISKKN